MKPKCQTCDNLNHGNYRKAPSCKIELFCIKPDQDLYIQGEPKISLQYLTLKDRTGKVVANIEGVFDLTDVDPKHHATVLQAVA